MKILIWGDAHISFRKPRRRTDENYFITVLDKVRQVLYLYHKHNCKLLIQTGDFFDSIDIGNRVIAEVIRLLLHDEVKVQLVFGQHDVAGHSAVTLGRSPLSVLCAAGCANVLDDKGTLLNDNVVAYGASFGQDIPEALGKDRFSILVIHKMIGDRPLFPGQELESPGRFLKKHTSFDLICCGDYHYRFVSSTSDARFVINPGAMIRKTISPFDLEHEPAVVIFDTVTREYEVIKLDVKSVEERFDMSKEIQIENDELIKFIENLKTNQDTAISWKEILLEVLEADSVSGEVRDIIFDSISEVSK